MKIQRIFSVAAFLASTLAVAKPQLINLQNYPFDGMYQSTMSSDSLFFEREDFDRSGEEKTVQVLPDHKALPYKVWMQKSPAPLILLIPGFNNHIRDSLALSLASFLYHAGFSVAGSASAYHAEFTGSALSSILPGYTPEDAKDVQRAYRLMLADLRRDYPGQVLEVGVTGYSMGGLHTLFLASLEKTLPEEERLGAKAFVSISPPVDPSMSLKLIDDAYDSFRNLPSDLRKYYFLNANERMSNLENARNPEQQIEFIRSVDDGSLKQIIATSFRWSLHEILSAAFRDHRLDDLIKNGPLGDLDVEYSNRYRQKLYKVLTKNYNFSRYLKDALLPSYQAIHSDWDADTFVSKSGIKAIAEDVKNNDKVVVLENLDDSFMLNPELIDWLKNTFEERLIFFDKGGHVGNLYMKEVQDVITSEFKQRLGVSDPQPVLK